MRSVSHTLVPSRTAMSPIRLSRARLASLDVKLPLFISVLLTLVVGVLLGVAYSEVRRKTVAEAGAHLSEATNEIERLLTAGAPPRLAEARQAAEPPSLLSFFRHPHSPSAP